MSAVATRLSPAATVTAPHVPPTVQAALDEVWERGGTDVLLTHDAAPLLRVDGTLRPATGLPVLSAADTRAAVAALLGGAAFSEFEAAREADFAFALDTRARVRGNAFFRMGAVAAALRVIPRAVPTVEELGLPDAVRALAGLSQGLVLVTGPTGSGKSTTLAALIDWINTHRALHIITVEDPVEYVHDHKRSAVNQREVGTDTPSFHAALRSALREDPDVLLVGEMRDLESIRFALTLAETGHLVFATVHTNDTAQAVDRLVDVFPPSQQSQIRVQLAATLGGVVYQRLLPRIEGGMAAAYEVLLPTSAVRALVRDGKTSQLRNVVATGQSLGMQTLEMGLSALVTSGTVAYADALALAAFPKEVAAGPGAAVPVGPVSSVAAGPAAGPTPAATAPTAPGAPAGPAEPGPAASTAGSGRSRWSRRV